MQKKIQQILEHSGVGYNTVGSYGVIAWGFDIHDRGEVLAAGGLVRQGNTRHVKASKYMPHLSTSNNFLKKDPSLEIERVLRAYGFTSAHFSTKTQRELVDVQGTKENIILDFGTYHQRLHFDQPAYWYPERKVVNAKPLIEIADLPAMQPRPELALPFHIWGSSETGRVDPQYDNPYIWAHRLAEDYRVGKATEHDVENFFNFMMSQGVPDPAYKNWSPKGRFCNEVMSRLIIP